MTDNVLHDAEAKVGQMWENSGPVQRLSGANIDTAQIGTQRLRSIRECGGCAALELRRENDHQPSASCDDSTRVGNRDDTSYIVVKHQTCLQNV